MPVKYSKITSKKQVTLPDYVMDALDLKPSDKVTFVLNDEGDEIQIKKIKDFRDYKGSIKSDKKFSIKEMDEAAKQLVVDNFMRKYGRNN